MNNVTPIPKKSPIEIGDLIQDRLTKQQGYCIGVSHYMFSEYDVHCYPDGEPYWACNKYFKIIEKNAFKE